MERLELVDLSTPRADATIGRPLGITTFETISISTKSAAPSAKSKTSGPPAKKRKLKNGETFEILSSDDETENKDNNDETIRSTSFKVWSHRFQLKIQESKISTVEQHLRSIAPINKGKLPIEVHFKKVHTIIIDLPSDDDNDYSDDEDDQVRDCTSFSINFSGKTAASITGEFTNGVHGNNFLDLFKKLNPGRKMQTSLFVDWSYIPTTVSADEPYIVLECNVRTLDSPVINWKSERWLPSFLSWALGNPQHTADLENINFELSNHTADIKPRDFYQSVHIPDPGKAVSNKIQVDELTTQMFPFQMRAVDWMMEREGVTKNNGEVKSSQPDGSLDSLCIEEAIDYDGKPMFLSIPLGITASNPVELHKIAAAFQIKGGILAEEMGLGKTVELISLLGLHRRTIPAGQEFIFDAFTGSNVRASGCTLIICPPSIVEQWFNELEMHAPGLRVLKYNGTRDLVKVVYQKKNGRAKRTSSDKQSEMLIEMQEIPNAELVNYLLEFDIVISSYSVLASEVHYTGRAPDRKLRYEKKFERRSCPLVEISWWRVCLDEAQMVESGVSNAAQVARLIPRINAWAVTGTPVQKSVDDLFGLLVFLRQDPWCSNKMMWEKLCFKKEWFSNTFKQIVIRHTKDIVREEIRLPRQHRTAISLGFSAVEEENYQRLFEVACGELGVNTDGSPLVDTWNPDSDDLKANMRKWLVRLRQTCVNPQVGLRTKRALAGKARIKTVDEVLDIMVQQNAVSFRQDARMAFMAIANKAQIILESLVQPETAIYFLARELENLENEIEECRVDAKAYQSKKQLATATRELEQGQKDSSPKDATNDEIISEDQMIIEDENSDPEDEDDEQLADGTERNHPLNQLRDILNVKHIYHFLLGSAYFNLKDSIPEDDESRSEERLGYEQHETSEYEKSKVVRKELLADSEKKVWGRIQVLQEKARNQGFVEIPNIDIKAQKGGIESNTVIEDIQILAEKLNDQAELLDDWREKLIELLQAPLIDQNEEVDDEGNELQKSAEDQDAGYLYVALIKTVLADRAEALSGITSGLAALEIRTAKKTAECQDEGHQTLFQLLKAKRDEVKPLEADSNIMSGTSAMPFSLKGLIAKLRSIAHSHREGNATGRGKVEAALIGQALEYLQPLLKESLEIQKKLEKEVAFFSQSFNFRLEFYRQLQVISDSVQQFDEKEQLKVHHVKEVGDLVKKHSATAIRLASNASKAKARGKFLKHLRETPEGTQRDCIICRDTIENGVLTVCGHQFCMECLEAWFKTHRSCPMCKKSLRKTDLHPVVYKEQAITIEKEVRGSAAKEGRPISAHSNSNGDDGLKIYTGIDETTFEEIKKIRLKRLFGSKIDMVVKHLLWIRQHTGGKSVIFSQWREVLDIFQRALESNHIGFSSLEDKRGVHKFYSDPDCEVFLLHAKSQSAGLTLVAASNVFLCEPLVNTGLELQAIARVHRIGQKRETNVFLYVIGNTVEESVWRHSTKRRLEMIEKGEGSPVKKRKTAEGKGKGKMREGKDYSPDLEIQLENANSIELQEGVLKNMLEKHHSGGEVVDNEQLWSCLFGVKRKDRGAELLETRREMFAGAREEGRGNLVDDSGEAV